MNVIWTLVAFLIAFALLYYVFRNDVRIPSGSDTADAPLAQNEQAALGAILMACIFIGVGLDLLLTGGQNVRSLLSR